MINSIFGQQSRLDSLKTLQNNIATVLSKENDKTQTDIDNRLEELQTQLLKLANPKADFEDVADEIKAKS